MADQQLSLFDTEVIQTHETDEIIDLDLSVTKKKKFRFDHDNDRIVELNVSDMNILTRMSEAYPKLQQLQDKASKLMDGINLDTNSENEIDPAIYTMSERLNAVDTEMRNLIDFMFNADVSAKAAPDGTMYDPFNGDFRYNYIITLLMDQYENNLNAEFKKMEQQLNKHTAKYIKK